MKIQNMTTKTSLEIQDTDVLIIQDGEDTKQVSVGDLRDYLVANGISKSTKMLINETLDNVINSLKASKYVISELMTYRMNTVINDAESGDVLITLKNMSTDKWLTAQDIVNLLVPNEEEYLTKRFVIRLMIDDIYRECVSYEVLDANEISDVIPESNIGYIKAHFEGLTQNEIAGITYEDIIITVEDTEYTVVLPIEDIHGYEFVGDPDLFKNNVPHVINVG